MNKATRAISILAVAAVLVAACGGPAASTAAPTAAATTAAEVATATATTMPQPQPGGDVVFAMNGVPETLDTATAYEEQEAVILRLICDPLVAVDQDHVFHPGLATSWEQSPDATSFTLTLRQDVVFQDGTPFNAEAVKANFDRFGNPEVSTGVVSNLFNGYTSTDVVDEYTVRVNFDTPHPSFVMMALGYSYVCIASPTAMQTWGADYGRHPVSTGPFMVSEWVPGESITLVRNPTYNWAPEIFHHQGPAYLDSVTFRFITEQTTRVAMLQTGEASVVEQFPAQDFSWLQTDPAYYMVSADVPGMPTVMFMNVTKPPMDELAVRQALIYAVDQESLVTTAYFGTEGPSHSVLAPSTLDFDSVANEMYSYDPARAESLLTDAGWVDTDGDGVRERNGEELTIIYPAYRLWEGEFMELIQSMWQAVGFRVDMTSLESAAAWDAAVNGDFNVTNMGGPSVDASILRLMFHSSFIAEGYAFTRYADPQLDNLLDQAGAALDATQRASLYAQAQQLIMEQALVVPVYTFERILAVRAEFPGLTLDWEQWNPYFYDVYLQPQTGT
jgi:peptide/nickel transport system substrate-binding protein